MRENWRNGKFGTEGQFGLGNRIQSNFKGGKKTGFSWRSRGRNQ